uniref:Transducer of ERBB2, 1a n=1 Tax=Eptatretus burgeri TaxID=7764 RepID=A0A8C4R228_EPTBU
MDGCLWDCSMVMDEGLLGLQITFSRIKGHAKTEGNNGGRAGRQDGCGGEQRNCTATMQLEVQVALNFIISYLYNKLPRRRVNIFGEELERLLRAKYEGHWYPERPYRGSGYRCVHVGETVDPIIEQAARESGLDVADVRAHLPAELSVWVDPAEVSYQIGEKGPVKVLYAEAAESVGSSEGTVTAELGVERQPSESRSNGFNPHAPLFLPVSEAGVSGNGSGTNGSGPSSCGSPSPPAASPTFLPRVPQPLTFTTAAFAATKFGSTKMKSVGNGGRRNGNTGSLAPGAPLSHRTSPTQGLLGKATPGALGPFGAQSGGPAVKSPPGKELLFPGLAGGSLPPLFGRDGPLASPGAAQFGAAFDLFPSFGPLGEKPGYLEGLGLPPLQYSAPALQPVIMAS